MSTRAEVALGRDRMVGPDPTWEALPEAQRKQWLDDIADFPPPPLLLELLQMDLRLESYDPQQLAQRISHDPILTGRILARANSAVIAPIDPITSLKQAMVHLGYNLVRSTVVRYQVEVSALRLQGIVREHIIGIQRSTDSGAIIAYNWAKVAGRADPASVATLCLLGRLGTFLLCRRRPERMREYFAAGHEPQRLNFEANEFGITTRTLTYKVAQSWRLPEEVQSNLFHLWTPLFSEYRGASQCIASASLALSFDPPHHIDDIGKWLSLRVHTCLRDNLDACGALKKLPGMFDSEIYQREMATVETT